MQGVPAQAEFFQHTGTEVLDKNVGVGQQLFQDIDAIGMLEVEGQRLFVAGLDEPPQRRALVQLAPFA
ncbi:hypothetical protein D3C80_1716360 [compost metagenome]